MGLWSGRLFKERGRTRGRPDVDDGSYPGSTNFDNRSFRINDEANLNIYDPVFAARQTQVFAEDLSRARRISLQEWQDRPLKEKIKERLALLLDSQL